MKIVALETENIKKIKAVSIKPDGSLVVIGGENEAGKSSVIDSIEYALAGQGRIPSQPIRQGQGKAKVVLDLGDIEVTRTFTQKGTKLIVKNKDGALFPSPQAMLDKLVGNLSFDPLEFSRMESKEQVNTLKMIVGLDFDELNNQYKKLFDERTITNRDGKALKAQRDALTLHENIPNEEISIAALSKSLTETTNKNNEIFLAKKNLDDNKKRLSDMEVQLNILKNQLAELQMSYNGLFTTVEKQAAEIELMLPEDTDVLQKQINEAEGINKKIRENKQTKILDEKLNILRTKSQSLTKELEKIGKTKTDLLAEAKLPIDNLVFDDNCVMYKNIPFDQCSTAQKIKISVAMGIAMNPTLRVLLIREGSLLDSNNLKMIAEMANNADAQLWIERVGQGQECSVIIHDGEIVDGSN